MNTDMNADSISSDKLNDVIQSVIQSSNRNFTESIDVDINIALINKKSREIMRLKVNFPNIFDSKKIAVFTNNQSLIDSASDLGVFRIGFDDLLSDIMKKKIDFDLLLAEASSMPKLSKCAKILGPRGLMPNDKDGTLTSDVLSAITEIKKGERRIKSDPAGIIHSSVGRTSMVVDQVEANFKALFNSVNDFLATQVIKNKGVLSVFMSSTMGKSYTINFKEFLY